MVRLLLRWGIVQFSLGPGKSQRNGKMDDGGRKTPVALLAASFRLIVRLGACCFWKALAMGLRFRLPSSQKRPNSKPTPVDANNATDCRLISTTLYVSRLPTVP
jgi:hypothetical protein